MLISEKFVRIKHSKYFQKKRPIFNGQTLFEWVFDYSLEISTLLPKSISFTFYHRKIKAILTKKELSHIGIAS